MVHYKAVVGIIPSEGKKSEWCSFAPLALRGRSKAKVADRLPWLSQGHWTKKIQ